MIHKIGDYMEMKDGIFRCVIPTMREGQEYPLADVNPKIDDTQDGLSLIWQHIEKSFILSKNDSKFNISTIRNIGSKIDAHSKRLKQILQEVQVEITKDLTELFNETRDPYKPEVIGIKIDGFKDGQLFGVVGLDRALPVNENDLERNRTVPFTEGESETPQEYVTRETETEVEETETPHEVQY